MHMPEGWKKAKLAEKLAVLKDGTHFSPQSKSGPFMYLTSRNIRFGGLNLENVSYITEEEHQKIYKGSPVKYGDVLLTKDGANTGNAAINSLDFEFSLLSSVAFLRGRSGVLSNNYLLHLLLSPIGQSIIKSEMAGQAITRLTLQKIGNLIFLFPPINEQQKIAQILSTWDKAIEKLEALIAAKQKLKKALMQQLLTGKNRFAEFDKEWKAFHLAELFKERNETGHVDLNLLSITREKGVIPRDEVERKDTSNDDKSKYLRICPGDIGYNTMRMWQGVSALSTLEGIISPAYTVCIPTAKIDGKFASYLFKSTPTVHLFQRYSQGLTSDTWNLKFHHFGEIKVFIPLDIKEQQKIASVLTAADTEIETHQKQLAALKQQKKGLMQQLLTGKKRVKVDGDV